MTIKICYFVLFLCSLGYFILLLVIFLLLLFIILQDAMHFILFVF